MKVRWSLTALIELEEIFAYIFERNRRAAKAVVVRLDRVTERLESFPFTGTEADEENTYILPIVRYPYMLYYTVDIGLGEVRILHVRHTARKKPAADDPRAG
jgi:plasmid stabilization system protein ParE